MADRLKVCHLSTAESAGGAGRAARRLHKAFLDAGADSRLVVMLKTSDDPSVETPPKSIPYVLRKLTASYLDNVPLLLYGNRKRTKWSPGFVQVYPVDRLDCVRNADLIILYWTCAGFLSIETVRRLGKLGKPIFWRLSDMWPFTGGCHYSAGCDKYEDRCGSCPLLESSRQRDLSRRMWNRKQRKWKDIPFTVVCPSRWIARCAKRSSLFGDKRVEVLSTGIDTKVFRPMARETCRALLGLPPGRKMALFGALDALSDPRKGSRYLEDALIAYSRNKRNPPLDLVVFGTSRKPERLAEHFEIHVLGNLGDDVSLSLAYNACDLFVAPSREENLANTVLESLACGTPCVAFDIGGMPDLIEHCVNGYLAKPFEVDELARGLGLILADGEENGALRTRAVSKVQREFKQEDVCRRYLALYEEIASGA